MDSGNITELFSKLNELSEEEKIELKQYERKSAVKKFHQEDPRIQFRQAKKDLIRTFPLPKTEEDIIDFLTQATPLAKPKSKSIIEKIFRAVCNFFSSQEGVYNLTEEWTTKCEQVINSARISMKDNERVLPIIEGYAKKLNV